MAYTNSLGMIFKCCLERCGIFHLGDTGEEYSAYADTNEGLGELWKDQWFAGPFKQELTIR